MEFKALSCTTLIHSLGWPFSSAGLALCLAYVAFCARTPHWAVPVVWYNFTPAGHKIHCSVTGLALACLLILDCRNRDRGTAWASRQMSSPSLWPFQTCSPEDRLSNMISFQRASLLPFLWLLRRRRWRSLNREQITPERLKKKKWGSLVPYTPLNAQME